MFPVPYNELTKGELVNQAAIYASDEQRAQGAMPSYATPSFFTPASSGPTQAQIDAFNDLLK